MKTIKILLMLFSVTSFSQNFIIDNNKPAKEVVFKEIKNDTVNVEVLYKNSIKQAKRIVKRIKCTYDYNEKLEGVIYRKVSHYVIDGKEVDKKNIIYARTLNDFTIIDNSDFFHLGSGYVTPTNFEIEGL